MKKLEIVYEDDYMVAINKPADLLTIPDRFRKDIPNLYDLLIQDRNELYTVHRLDKMTSGGILFAKDKETHRTLSGLFMDRIPKKYYAAIVDGIPRKNEGIIEQPLTESMTTRGKMLVHPRGKASKTAYTVIESFEKFSYLKVQIFSGRLHQIRVHLSHIGHPLVVDPLYGKRDEFFLSEIKRRRYRMKKDEEERALVTRQPLHSHRLVLPHPVTNEQMDLNFELPKDMKAILNQFRKILK